MSIFIICRILISIPILLASSFLVFSRHISGDPLAALRESQNPNKDQQIAQMRSDAEPRRPVPERYWEWLKGVVTLDFGVNKRGQDVWPILSEPSR